MKLVPFALVLFLGACSSSDEETSADFTGTWTTTAGTQEVTGCQFRAKHENLALTYTVVKGIGADLKLQSTGDPYCELNANIVDKRALVVSGQTCTRSDGTYKDTYSYAATSVMDLTNANAPTIKLDATFKRALADGTDTGYECGFTEESPLTKN